MLPTLPLPASWCCCSVAIEIDDVDAWLFDTESVARSLVRLPPVDVFEAGPT